MAFSKITLNGTTLMDVTQKTVAPETMVSGATALKNDGTDITGTYVPESGGDAMVPFATVDSTSTSTAFTAKIYLSSGQFSITQSRIDPSTGSPIWNNNSYRTDYIPCESGDEISFRGRSAWWDGAPIAALLAFYDDSKTFISSVSKFSDAETSNTTGTITATAPSNAAYFIAGTYSVVNESYVKWGSEKLQRYYEGLFFYLHNGVITSASGCTLNINGIGALPICNTSGNVVTTSFQSGKIYPVMYSSINSGCFIISEP